MNEDFALAMRQALDHTRAGDVHGATSIIQAALAGRTAATAAGSAHSGGSRPQRHRSQSPIDRDAEIVDPEVEETPEPPRKSNIEAVINGDTMQAFAPPRMKSAERSRLLEDGGSAAGLTGLAPEWGPNALKEPASAPSGFDGARFLSRSFACAAGARPYKLFVPADMADRPRGLVVMLHGCTQTPDDFAMGTNMNAVAEAHGLLVAYPAQTTSDNIASCWNWFRPDNQARDHGEPAIIAGITRAIVSEFGLERDRTFIAGLSAGGAMAAVMAEIYPDLYAAVGIHSGLAHASANDLMSSFAAMRGSGAPKSRPAPESDAIGGSASRPRVIVFHGSADQTVHPSNAERIVAAARASCVPEEPRRERRTTGDGRGYTRSVVHGADGAPRVEYWLIDHTGHAWSGGNPNGSYTDPGGPDASAEMVRFFLNGL